MKIIVRSFKFGPNLWQGEVDKVYFGEFGKYSPKILYMCQIDGDLVIFTEGEVYPEFRPCDNIGANISTLTLRNIVRK